ncbi:IS66 family transposase [Nannocystis exedens]|uniref:IS66 family transposase n=1 Tax=Nannocystis exedens TaxID=54 RepID=UPI000BBA0A0C
MRAAVHWRRWLATTGPRAYGARQRVPPRADRAVRDHAPTITEEDHTPLHRQGGIYARDGLELSRSTFCGWHEQLVDLVEPLVDRRDRRPRARRGAWGPRGGRPRRPTSASSALMEVGTRPHRRRSTSYASRRSLPSRAAGD